MMRTRSRYSCVILCVMMMTIQLCDTLCDDDDNKPTHGRSQVMAKWLNDANALQVKLGRFRVSCPGGGSELD
jgi:hypothetical protein